jgi:hypothetical protein
MMQLIYLAVEINMRIETCNVKEAFCMPDINGC